MPKLFVTPKKKSRKTLILIIGILVLLAAGAGGYYYWSSTQKNSQADDASIKKVNNDELAVEFNKLMAAKDYDKAKKLVEFQDGSNSDPSKIVLLAEVSVEKGETNEALKILATAAESDTKNAYYFKGHQARIMADSGDTQGALAKYQEAIDLAGKATSSNENEALLIAQRIGDYEYAVNQLKGTQ